MHDRRQKAEGDERSWWPIFSRRKAQQGKESLFGWLDDLRARPADKATRPTAPLAATPEELQPAPPAVEVAAPPQALEVEAPAVVTTVTPPEPIQAAQPEPAPEEVEIEREAEAAAPLEHEPLQEPVAEEVAPTPEPEAPPEPVERESLFSRLKRGLTRSAETLAGGIGQIFTTRKIDEDALQDLEDLLISADLGVATAAHLAETLRETRIENGASGDEVKGLLAGEVEKVLAPVETPLSIDAARKPHVVLVVGVNGTGKTTTIGKLAQKLKSEGKSVMLAAGDTFRAAAVEQLKVWGERVGAEVITRETGADAAGLSFDALEKAKAEGIDVLLIDTAGRLQNKSALMAELEKIIRVIKKLDPDAPHSVIQVLDATTGQNAITQVEAFQKTAGVTGLVMTKLDGTARGGILVPLAQKFALPIHAIGVGESVEDLQPFSAHLFARALVGLEDAA